MNLHSSLTGQRDHHKSDHDAQVKVSVQMSQSEKNQFGQSPSELIGQNPRPNQNISKSESSPVASSLPTNPTNQASQTPIPIKYPTPPGIELSERFPGMVKPLAEELVYEWQAGSRPYTKHSRHYYLTIGTIVVLLSLILFFAGQILPILVVLSVAFLAYAFSAVPPQQMMYRITTYGIRLEEKLYPWEVMGRFWFEKKGKQKLVLIETAQFPNRLTMVLADPNQEAEVTTVLSEVLLHQRPPLTWSEKAAKWLQKHFPLELEP